MIKTLLSIFKSGIIQDKTICDPNHVHDWEFIKEEPYFWSLVNDKPIGESIPIEKALNVVRSQVNDTSELTLLLWQENGFNRVFANVLHWKCNCGRKEKTFYYSYPIYLPDIKKNYFYNKKKFLFDTKEICDNIKI